MDGVEHHMLWDAREYGTVGGFILHSLPSAIRLMKSRMKWEHVLYILEQ